MAQCSACDWFCACVVVLLQCFCILAPFRIVNFEFWQCVRFVVVFVCLFALVSVDFSIHLRLGFVRPTSVESNCLLSGATVL